jgi:hypothetical protein
MHEVHRLGKGMPLGNLTSQIFANIYLNELDVFVKHELRAKYYIRYVDDFVILHQSKEKLDKYKGQINEFLKAIRLELHPEKSQVYPLHHGTSFLGFRVFYHYKIPKKSNIRLYQRKLDSMIESNRSGELSKEKIMASVDGWLSYSGHGNTHKMRSRIKEQCSTLL